MPPTHSLARVLPLLALPLLVAVLRADVPAPVAAPEAPVAVAPPPAAEAPPATPVFNILAFGAVDDARVSSTGAFARAIAACAKAGGGTVEVPAGHFLTGPITMVDHMNLHLALGAVILFDTDRALYPEIVSRWEGLAQKGPRPLLFADGCRGIAITGQGIVDGQGSAWWKAMDMAEKGNARPDRPIRRRPPLVQIRNCRDVRLEGRTFANSPFWNVHLLYSENVDVGNCRLISPPTSPNTDALNSDSCRNVVVHDCYADVGDDGFGIKAGRDAEGRHDARPCEYITYIRCHVAHAHSVCAIGSEPSGDVRHIRFIDCDGDGTDNGIRLKSMRGRGGVIEDVVATHIRLHNVRNAIVLSMRYVQTLPEPFSERTPIMRDIHISDVVAVGSETCAKIEGLEESPISDVTLDNLDLSGRTGVSVQFAKDIRFRDVRVAAAGRPYAERGAVDVQRVDWSERVVAPEPEGDGN